MVFVNGARLPVAMCVCVCLCSSRLFGALFRCLTIKTHDNKLFVVIYTDWTCIIGYENGCRWQIHWQYELHYIRTRIRKVRERRDNERKTKRKKHNRNESMFARAQKVKQLIVGFKTVYIIWFCLRASCVHIVRLFCSVSLYFVCLLPFASIVYLHTNIGNFDSKVTCTPFCCKFTNFSAALGELVVLWFLKVLAFCCRFDLLLMPAAELPRVLHFICRLCLCFDNRIQCK